MELCHQQLKGAKKELDDAILQAREHKDTVVIFKEKYTAAMQKVHTVQGQVGQLQEELQYAQQQVYHTFQKVLYYCMLLAQGFGRLLNLHLPSSRFLKYCLCIIQLKESQLATHSVTEEKAEMTRRYQDKVSQWEKSQEALDQLADWLEASQNRLGESRQKADHLKVQMEILQDQVDTLKQQVGTKNTVLYSGTSQKH